jgi:hypothetical protein
LLRFALSGVNCPKGETAPQTLTTLNPFKQALSVPGPNSANSANHCPLRGHPERGRHSDRVDGSAAAFLRVPSAQPLGCPGSLCRGRKTDHWHQRRQPRNLPAPGHPGVCRYRSVKSVRNFRLAGDTTGTKRVAAVDRLALLGRAIQRPRPRGLGHTPRNVFSFGNIVGVSCSIRVWRLAHLSFCLFHPDHEKGDPSMVQSHRTLGGKPRTRTYPDCSDDRFPQLPKPA